MKKLFIIVACVGALAVVGCGGKDSPENFGKKYIEKKFENLNCNLVDLKYNVKADGEDAATVQIEGKIKYNETIHLIKKDGEWKIGDKSELKAEHAKKAEAVKEESKAEKKAEEKAPAKTEAHGE